MLRGAALLMGFMGGSILRSRQVADAYTLPMHNKSSPTSVEPLFSDKYRAFPLGEVINLAEDVAIFRFLTPNVDDEFTLPVSSTLQFCDKKGVNMVDNVTRMYTPITPNGTKGYFDILVKKQQKGRMTEALFGMSIGETMLMRRLEYSFHYAANKYKRVGMIAGGTGITPMLQVIEAAVNNPADRTQLSLLFANQTERKILLEGLLEALKRKSNLLQCYYTVDRVVDPSSWSGFVGYITKDMIAKTMPPPLPGNYILVCGPDKMMENVVGAHAGVLRAMSGAHAMQPAAPSANNFGDLGGFLNELGYSKDQVFRF